MEPILLKEDELDTEMAAPDELRTPYGTRAKCSIRECEWKQGESAAAERVLGGSTGSLLPLVVDRRRCPLMRHANFYKAGAV